MSHPERTVILGGHGKVALLTIPRLKEAGFVVDAIIRKPEHCADIRALGGNPVVLNLETADIDALATAFRGARAIVFSAGAGGGNPPRTHAVDYEAATRAMRAAEQAGVMRFVMVSYAGAAHDIHRLNPANPFYPYAKAKHNADACLRQSPLDYTILGPARLTLEAATGRIQRTETAGPDWPDEKRITSRDNVAAAIAHVIQSGAASRQTVNFYDGDTPIAEAMPPA